MSHKLDTFEDLTAFTTTHQTELDNLAMMLAFHNTAPLCAVQILCFYAGLTLGILGKEITCDEVSDSLIAGQRTGEAAAKVGKPSRGLN